MTNKKQSIQMNATASTTKDRPFDEVSIAELVRDIGKQWKVVVGVAMISTLGAFIYTYLQPELYRYTTEIEIGQMPRGHISERATFIMVPPARLDPYRFQSPNTVRSKIENAWLPQAIIDLADDTSGEKVLPNINFRVTNPEDEDKQDTLLVKMVVLARKEEENPVKAILANVAARVVAEHAAYLEAYMNRKQRSVARLYENKALADQQLAAYEKRIGELQGLINGPEQGSLAAAIELNTLMPQRLELAKQTATMSESIDKAEDEIAVLGAAVEAFRVGKLDSEILRNQWHAASAVQTSLSIQPTHVLGLPTRSVKPVGENPKLIIMLALLLGFGAGLVLALVVQAVVRERGLKNS